MKTPSLKLLPTSAVLRVAPFLLGPLVVPPPFGTEFLPGYIRSYLIFVFMFIFWAMLRSVVLAEQRLRMSNPDKKKPVQASRAVRLRNYLALTVSSLLFLASLKPFETIFGREAFYVALAAMIAAAIADSYQLHQRYMRDSMLRVLQYGGIGYLSFKALPPLSDWLPVMLSAGIAFMLAAQGMPASLEQLVTKLAERKPEKRAGSPEKVAFCRLSRLFIIFCIAAPMAVALLVYADQAPRIYLSIFIILALSIRPFNALQQAEESAEIPPRFAQETTGISLLYIVIIGILTLLY